MEVQTEDEYFDEIFSIFDKDGNGVICQEEFCQVLQAFCFNPTPEEMKKFLEDIDTNKSGKLEKHEVKLWLDKSRQRLKHDKEELENAFKMFDRNNDGFIKRDELRSILNKLGQAITEEELCEMIEKADADRDGKIDIKEFAQFLSKPV